MASGPRGKREHDGVLRGHYKSGRVYRPELLAYPETTPNDWVRDDLPDLLWPLVLVGLHGRRGSAAMSRLQERVVAFVESGELEETDVELDGRLTSLEACAPVARALLLSFLQDEETRELVVPRELVAVLRMYSDVPGSWLLVERWADLDGVPDFETAATVLTDAIVGALENRHLNALTKAAPFGWSMLSGKMHFASEMRDILINYPMDDAKRPHADAFILSSFLSSKGIHSIENPEAVTAADGWARHFWAQNWELFPCLVEDEDQRDTAPNDDATREPAGPSDATPAPDRSADRVTNLIIGALDEIDEIYQAFLHEALDRSLPVDLYSPARHEVLCGLIARAYRAVVAVLRGPHLWTGEHASGTQRMFSESGIVIRWLIAHGDEAFERYQVYGRGRTKLMRKHAQTLVERLGDQAPDLLKDVAEQLEDKTGGAWHEEFQEVSLESTFAGVSLRRMAEEVDALDEYRYVMQPASGVLHGEWWVLEDYAMQRCYQILHRGHWLPVTTAEGHPTLAFSQLMVVRFDDLVALARSGLRDLKRMPG